MIKSSHILVIKTTKNWSSIICKQQPYASWPLSYKQVTSLRFRNHNGKMMFVGRLGVKPSLMCPFHEMAMFLLHRSLSLHGHTMSCDLNFFFFIKTLKLCGLTAWHVLGGLRIFLPCQSCYLGDDTTLSLPTLGYAKIRHWRLCQF